MLLNSVEMNTPAFTEDKCTVIEMDRHLSKAFIRYARYDIVAHVKKMRFGEWNDCPLQKAQVNGLITSFKVDRVNRFKPSNAIPIVISKKYVKVGSFGNNGNAMEELKEMEITEEALKLIMERKPVLYVASGQHRIEALSTYQTYLMKQRRHLEKKKVDEVNEMEIEEENTIEKPRCDEITGSLAFHGQWMVTIYDYSKFYPMPNILFT